MQKLSERFKCMRMITLLLTLVIFSHGQLFAEENKEKVPKISTDAQAMIQEVLKEMSIGGSKTFYFPVVTHIMSKINNLNIVTPDVSKNIDHNQLPDDIDDLIRWTLDGIKNKKDENMQKIFPEGYVFCNFFVGSALVNSVQRDKGNAEKKKKVLKILKKIMINFEKPIAKKVFVRVRNKDLKYGVFYNGLKNLIYAGYLSIEEDKEIRAKYDELSKKIHTAYSNNKNGLLESLEAQVWACDNMPALYSLKLHDEFYGTKYINVYNEIKKKIQANLDKNGFIPTSYKYKSYNKLQQARGTSLSWALSYLSLIDEEFARQQWTKYKQKYWQSKLGISAFREWPDGQNGFADVDSGPIISGFGTSASGFGIAPAVILKDKQITKSLISALETFGGSAPLNKRKHYFGGNFYMADCIAAWAMSHCKWVKQDK